MTDRVLSQIYKRQRWDICDQFTAWHFRKALNAEPLLFRIKRSQLRWLRWFKKWSECPRH